MSVRQRNNLLDLPQEHWRPPRYSGGRGIFPALKIHLSRFFDLQAGTIWRDLSRELPQVKGTVLDAGCGDQPYRRLFQSDVRYIGIDTVDAKAHFGFETAGTLYYSGDKWPVENESADFILCTETLEHIPEPSVFLTEAFRALRSGGRILITVPFCARWHYIPHDYWLYTPSGLDKLLKKSGFTNVQVYARGNPLTVACYKTMAFIFILVFPAGSNFIFNLLSRFLGFLSLPFLFATALVANFTLWKDGRVDCLGFTVLAERFSKSLE
jgi:SAM-dependent methyltransferase